MKSTSRLIRHLNTCKSHNYTTTRLKIPQEHHKEKDGMSENWEDESDLLDKTDNTASANGTFEMPTKDTSRKELPASKSLTALRKEWFSSYKFSAGIRISDIKYRYQGSKHNNSFYPFNDQLNYSLAHYFTKSETTKGNVNKFLTDPLIPLLIGKLSYKNADEWIEKLSEIL